MPLRVRSLRLGKRGVTALEYALIAAVTILAVLALAPAGQGIIGPLEVIGSSLIQ